MLSRMKFEIEPLVAEILDQLPESLWTSDSTTFFDPAIGGGQFVQAIEQRLRAHGHADSNIRRRVFGFEESDLHIRYAVNKHKLVGQYVRKPYEKFFLLDNSMKFDVIIGNPPYQAPKKGDYSFWARFVDGGYKILNDNGYMSMIIPAGWMSPTNDIRQGQRSVMRDIFAKENTSYINIDPDLGKKYFPGIGQKFTWFLLKKGQYSSTKIDFGNSIIDVDLSKMPMLAKETDSVNLGILSKLSANADKWEFTRCIMKESWDDVSFDPLPDYLPRINGNSNHLDKVAYLKNKCKYHDYKKVVLPYNGSDYKFVVDDGSMGCTNAYVMTLSESDLIESAVTYFTHPLLHWVGKNKFTQYNEGALINSVSKIDLTKKVTKESIYQLYNLTQKEIDYVEVSVK
jgi:hypothetical protein